MNNLTIAVILIAVAQTLTIILTLGREREIRRLRELVTEHRIQIAEIKAWLAGRMQSAQPRRIRTDREPIADDKRVPEPAITPKDLPDTVRPSTPEDELSRATKAFKWFKEDADEPREIGAGPKGGTPPEPAITPKDLPDAIRPGATEDELKRATKANDWSREIVAGLQAGLQLQRGAPPVPAITRVPEPATTPKGSPDSRTTKHR